MVAFFDIHEPIPNLSELRADKADYRDWPIGGRCDSEPLVDLADFGILGASFYSQPLKETGELLHGVDPRAMVRLSVADRLYSADEYFRLNREVAEVFSGPVRIKVRDAYRSNGLQTYLNAVEAPRLVRKQHPDWSEAEVRAKADRLLPKPQPGKPTAHMTGAAIDINLVMVEDLADIDFGHSGKTAYDDMRLPEYYERHGNNLAARDHRRALFWVMQKFGFVQNPDEWWHFSFGDQMWAWVRAYLGIANEAALYNEVVGASDLLLAWP